MPAIGAAPTGSPSLFEANAERNIFVIMRYGSDPVYEQIATEIKRTAAEYAFSASLAKDVWFHDNLWSNVEFCMKYSRYGIVVLERATQPDFNPNVALELGYMLGLNKHCLLLKEASLPHLPADIAGLRYEEFRETKVQDTIPEIVRRWLEALGHRMTSPEMIASDNVVQAKKDRTKRVIEALKQMRTAATLNCVSGCVRQAGSLSSLAISHQEQVLMDEDEELREYLLDERRAMESLLSTGVTVRCLISPFIQISSLQLNVLKTDHVLSDVIPRIEQLIRVIERHLQNPRLEIACTARLPHDNLLIDELGSQVFVGSRQWQQWGFPQTMIYRDPAVVNIEKQRFDSAFADAAAACMGEALPPEDYGSSPLKLKVIDHLKSCKNQLRAMVKKQEGSHATPAPPRGSA